MIFFVETQQTLDKKKRQQLAIAGSSLSVGSSADSSAVSSAVGNVTAALGQRINMSNEDTPAIKIDLKFRKSAVIASRVACSDRKEDDNDNQFINIYVTYVFQPQIKYINSIMKSAEALPAILNKLLESLEKDGIECLVDIESVRQSIAQGESFIF